LKAIFEFDVPDDFEVGENAYCANCPLNKYNLNINNDNNWYCGVVKPYEDCPLKLVDTKADHENELYKSTV
jgi:hypothetical protein